MSRGILFSQMIPKPGDVERFNAWYNDDHIPARMVLPHFIRASRYEPVAGSSTPDYLAVYEVDDRSAFDTQEYQELKQSPSVETDTMLSRISGFTRYIADELGDSGPSTAKTNYLSVVAFAVPEQDEEQFNAWYASEHIPMLLEANDWLRVRRYKVIDGIGGPWTHLALHELASLEVMESPERARARRGPLRERLVGLPWFQDSGRWLYRSLGTASAADYQHDEV